MFELFFLKDSAFNFTLSQAQILLESTVSE